MSDVERMLDYAGTVEEEIPRLMRSFLGRQQPDGTIAWTEVAAMEYTKAYVTGMFNFVNGEAIKPPGREVEYREELGIAWFDGKDQWGVILYKGGTPEEADIASWFAK